MISTSDIELFLNTASSGDGADAGVSSGIEKAGAGAGQSVSAEFSDILLLGIEKSDDERFHKLALVKHLRKLIDGAVGHLLDSEISNISDCAAKHDDVVPAIVDKIMTSTEYANLVSSVYDQVNQAVAQLQTACNASSVSNITARTSQPDLSRPQAGSNFSDATFNHHNSFSSHSNATNDSFLGSITSSSSIFAAPAVEEIRMIISNMKLASSVEARLGAAQKLCVLSTGDLLSSEFWNETKVGLELCLRDDDSRISMIGLRICARVFKSSPPPMVCELFLLLVDHLQGCWERGSVPKRDNEIDFGELSMDLMLRKFRLLLQFKTELPSCWLRFSDALVNNCFITAFRFLSVSDTQKLTPLHFISMLDPSALWLEKWMLSSIGRSQGVAAMKECGLVELLARLFVEFLCHQGKDNNGNGENRSFLHKKNGNSEGHKLNSRDLDYLNFFHVLLVLGKLVNTSCGRNFFPISIKNLQGLHPFWHKVDLLDQFDCGKDKLIFTVEGYIHTLVKLATSAFTENPSFVPNTQSADVVSFDFSISNAACNVLKSLTADEASCIRICTDDFLAQLIDPLESIQSNTAGQIHEAILFNIAQLLTHISSSDAACKMILMGKSEDMLTAKTAIQASSTHLSSILSFALGLMDRTLHSASFFSFRVLAAYIFFLRQLYRRCRGICLLEPLKIHFLIAESVLDKAWFDTHSKGMSAISFKEWTQIMIDNLLDFASTPRGVQLLKESGAIDKCMEHMFDRYQKKMQVSSCEKFGYGVLVSQVGVTQAGMLALVNAGFVERYVCNVFEQLDCGLTKGSIVAENLSLFEQLELSFAEPGIDIDDHAFQKCVFSIMKLVSSFSGLAAVLYWESEEASKLQWNQEYSLTYLLQKLVLVDRPIDDAPLFAFDESHQVL
ncbi:hypothetical protein HDU83_006104 [Entophlyctis luteolus]|nr:hypothetical protein HDU83_006104 [Entophlyctis luteolus]